MYRLYRFITAAFLLLLPAAVLAQTVTRFDQSDPRIVYNGTWYPNSNTTESGGSAVLTNLRSSQVVLMFNGTGINWIGLTDGYSGLCYVTIDGVQTLVDTSNPASVTTYQKSTWAIHNLTPGLHRLTIEVLHARDATTNGSWIWIDAFDVDNGTLVSTTDPAGSGQNEQTSASAAYSGHWFTNQGTAYSGGNINLASDTGSRVDFAFTGTSVNWIGYRDEYSGLADVYIDGNFQTTVDTYHSPAIAQTTTWSISGLTSGVHTLSIVVSGLQDANSGGAFVWVDRFDVNMPTAAPPGGGGGTTAGGITTLEQDSPDVVLSGDWGASNGAANSAGSVVLSNSATSSATVSFTGTAISWIGVKDSYNGLAKVFMDGTLVSTVDTSAPSTMYQQTLYTASGLTAGAHTLQIVGTGTHSASGLGNYIWIDAFKITGTANAPSSSPGTTGGGTGGAPTTTIEQTDPTIVYNGSWFLNTTFSHSGGTATFAGDANASATISFVGVGITWVGIKDTYNGIAQVYLDGALVATVDGYATFTRYQQALYTVTNLNPATHTLKIVALGTKNPSALGTAVWVDAFIIAGSAAPTVTPGGGGSGTPGAGTPGTGAGSPGRVESTDPSITYAGTWYQNFSPANSDSRAALAQDAGASATIAFSGSAITWVGVLDTYNGTAQIYLDGKLITTVDTYGTFTQYHHALYTASGLAGGAHTLQIVATGTRDSVALGNAVWVDAFDVTP